MQGDLLNIDQNNNSLSNSNNNLNNPMTQRSRTASQEASNHSSFYPASVHQQSPPPHQQSNSTFKENRNSWVGGAELEIYPHDDPHQVYASSSHDYSSSSNSHGSDYDPDFSSNESLIREYAINAGGWDVGDKRASFSGSNEDEGYYSNQNSGSVRSGKAVSRPRTKSSLFWKRKQVFFTICSNPWGLSSWVLPVFLPFFDRNRDYLHSMEQWTLAQPLLLILFSQDIGSTPAQSHSLIPILNLLLSLPRTQTLKEAQKLILSSLSIRTQSSGRRSTMQKIWMTTFINPTQSKMLIKEVASPPKVFQLGPSWTSDCWVWWLYLWWCSS